MSYTPNGLATVALLKTRLDEGHDHLGLFEPLVEDALANVEGSEFAIDEIRAVLQDRTGILLPAQTLKSLLGRFVRRKILKRVGDRFSLQSRPQADANLARLRADVRAQQQALGEAFLHHAADAGLPLENADVAIGILATVASENKVPLILNEPLPDSALERSSLPKKATRIAARFITQHCVDSSLRPAFQSLVEGMLIHDTAFLCDCTNASQRFQGLIVGLDTKILFAVIGLAGGPNGVAIREGLSLLRQLGARTIAFESTVDEMRRVLAFYEGRLATPSGIATLWPTDLRNHILSARYSPSDIRIISASLESRLQTSGISVVPLPEHKPRFTLDEKLLAELLSSDGRDTVDSPRVRHDVDAIAAVLTLRRGRTAASVERSPALFCSTTGKVVHNTQKWYRTQEQGGIPPAIHLSSLTSIAWLKKPAAAPGIKLHELVALCASAMRPTPAVWTKLTESLRHLRDEGAIKDDETVAIVVSELTEPLLAHLEEEEEEPGNASILGMIERVRGAYRREASDQAEELVRSAHADSALARQAAEDAKRTAQMEADMAREACASRDAALSVLAARIRRSSERLANGAFIFFVVVTVAAIPMSVPGVLSAIGPEWKWVARAVFFLAALLTAGSRILGGSLLAWRKWLALYLDRGARERLLEEPSIPAYWFEAKEQVPDDAKRGQVSQSQREPASTSRR